MIRKRYYIVLVDILPVATHSDYSSTYCSNLVVCDAIAWLRPNPGRGLGRFPSLAPETSKDCLHGDSFENF